MKTALLSRSAGLMFQRDTTPRYITIENLDIRSARTPYTFTAANGTTGSYVNNASSIYVEKGENITVRNCIIHDSGNGFFVASSDALASRDISGRRQLHLRQWQHRQHLRAQQLHRLLSALRFNTTLWPAARRVFGQQSERSLGGFGRALQLDRGR
jgi:parallel beta-helix repeat protein